MARESSITRYRNWKKTQWCKVFVASGFLKIYWLRLPKKIALLRHDICSLWKELMCVCVGKQQVRRSSVVWQTLSSFILCWSGALIKTFSTGRDDRQRFDNGHRGGHQQGEWALIDTANTQGAQPVLLLSLYLCSPSCSQPTRLNIYIFLTLEE